MPSWYNPQDLAKLVSTVGSIAKIPNMGFSGAIASQDPRQIVQPLFGLQPRPAYAAEKTPSTQDTGLNYTPINYNWDPGLNNKQIITDKGNSGSGGNGGNTNDRMALWRSLGNTGDLPVGWNGPGGGGGSQVDELGSIIDRDYETAMGGLASEEQNLRGSAEAATQTAVAGYAPAKTAITNEQATNEAGIAQQQQTAQTSAKSALQQARDLFRQTQQTNIAQLSGLGISSSSVAEALAERLGVETSRRIAGVTGSLNEVMQNASKELTRIQTYYKGKLSDLETQLGAAKANIQQQLLSGINQINQARNQAATDKANRRQELITNARAAADKLALDAQNFQQTLDLWREQKAAALTPIAQDPQYIQNILAQTQKLNEQFAPTGFSYTPEFNIDAQGNYTGQIKSNKKPEDENASVFTP